MNLKNARTIERVDEHRRRMVRLMAKPAIFARVSGSFGTELVRTPAQTEGPFYPDKRPLDTDNELGKEIPPVPSVPQSTTRSRPCRNHVTTTAANATRTISNRPAELDPSLQYRK